MQRKFAKPNSKTFIEHLQFRNRQKRSGKMFGGALAADAVYQSATLDANPLTGIFQSWADDPISAERVGRYQTGANLMTLSNSPFASIFTFTRPSKAWGYNSAGAWVELAADAIRQGYDPATLLPAGWNLEGAATNSIRNPRAEGVVVGSPGTNPTFWGRQTVTAILTQSDIVGTGVENGLTYIDFAFTTNATMPFEVSFDSGVVSANGQTWTGSFFAKLISGGAGVTFRASHYELGGVTANNNTLFTPDSTLRRIDVTRTNVQPGTTSQSLRLNVSTAGASSFVIRIAAPQLEQNYLASSIILPAVATPAATLRAADALSISGAAFNAIFGNNGAPSGFVIVDVSLSNLGAASRRAVAVSDGGLLNFLNIGTNSSGNTWVAILVAGGVQVGASMVGPATALGNVRLGIKWSPAGVGFSVNGGAVQSIANAPPPFSVLALGSLFGGTGYLNDRIRGVWAGSKVITDAQMQAACTLNANVGNIIG